MATSLAQTYTTSRITSLDGLRGVAALIVLIHHSLLTIPVLADPYYKDKSAEPVTIAWWFIHTPLHLLWEGKAAVYVFFILSGIVLTLPVINTAGRYSWRAFYPQRLMRLYLPVWGAVALAAVVFWALPRSGVPASLWLQERPESMNPAGILQSLSLILGPGGLISPLWSLQWEVLFSLSVPLYIWVARKFSAKHWLLLALCIAVSAVGGVMRESIFIYTPMFMIGVVIALRLNEIRAATGGWTTARWAVVTAIGAVLMCSRWIALAFEPSRQLTDSMVGLTLVGATIVVIVTLAWPELGDALSTRVPIWLGTVSFSVYLIHEPIVVGLGYLAGPNLWWSVPTGIIAALTIGHVFYEVVEKRSHRLARKLKAWLAA